MFVLKIETGNDAFACGNKYREIARLLRRAIEHIEVGEENQATERDINGNAVLTYTITED